MRGEKRHFSKMRIKPKGGKFPPKTHLFLAPGERYAICGADLAEWEELNKNPLTMGPVDCANCCAVLRLAKEYPESDIIIRTHKRKKIDDEKKN